MFKMSQNDAFVTGWIPLSCIKQCVNTSSDAASAEIHFDDTGLMCLVTA